MHGTAKHCRRPGKSGFDTNVPQTDGSEPFPLGDPVMTSPIRADPTNLSAHKRHTPGSIIVNLPFTLVMLPDNCQGRHADGDGKMART